MLHLPYLIVNKKINCSEKITELRIRITDEINVNLIKKYLK